MVNDNKLITEKMKSDCIDYLRKHADKFTAYQLAEKFGVSHTTIRKWCKKFTNKHPMSKPHDERLSVTNRIRRMKALEFLKDNSSKYTYIELSNLLNYSVQSIRVMCKKNDFKVPLYKSESERYSKVDLHINEPSLETGLNSTANRLICTKLI